MRFNEISEEQINERELQPGEVPGYLDARRYFGQGKANVQTMKQDQQITKNLYKQWSTIAVRIDQALKDDPEKAEKTINYFKAYLSKVLRIPATDPIFNEIEAMLGNGANYSSKTVMQAIGQAVQKRQLAQLGRSQPKPPTPPTGGPPAPNIISGQTQTAGGVEYVWNGSEWRNSATGAVATAPIAAALTASTTGGVA